MKNYSKHIGLIAILSVFLFTGCYTQLQTMHYHDGYYVDEPRDRFATTDQNDNRSSVSDEEAAYAEIPEGEEETYLSGYEEGYEGGWLDAEYYYFRDHENARWFRESGATLSARKSFGSVNYTSNYYGYNNYYAPYYWNDYYYSPFSMSLNFRFGNWYHSHHPYSYYSDPFAWHHSPYSWGFPRYPIYYGHPFGYSYYPYYGNSYFLFNNNYYYSSGGSSGGSQRTFGIRTTGLTSGGVNRGSQSRGRDGSVPAINDSSSRTSGLSDRTREIRSNAGSTLRSTTVNRGSSSGTVNRGTGTVRTPTQGQGDSSSPVRRNSDNNRSQGTVQNRVSPPTRVGQDRLAYPTTRSPQPAVQNRIQIRSDYQSGNQVRPPEMNRVRVATPSIPDVRSQQRSSSSSLPGAILNAIRDGARSSGVSRSGSGSSSSSGTVRSSGSSSGSSSRSAGSSSSSSRSRD